MRLVSRRAGRLESEPRGPVVALAGLPGGLRVAGVVVALGLALGVAPGTVPSFVAALALTSAGRGEALRTSMSVAAVGLALGIGALRWSTMDLQQLFGIQEVLGPSLMVGPATTTAAGVLSFAAALAALIVWAAPLPQPLFSIPGPVGRWSNEAWTWLESWALATGVASVFLRPGRPILAPAVGLAVAAVVAGGATALRRLGPAYAWAVLGAAAAASLVAAALLVEAS